MASPAAASNRVARQARVLIGPRWLAVTGSHRGRTRAFAAKFQAARSEAGAKQDLRTRGGAQNGTSRTIPPLGLLGVAGFAGAGAALGGAGRGAAAAGVGR